jgi:mRNA interferase MazF
VTPGDAVLIPLARLAGGSTKLRPALLLALLPGPYPTHLVRGISTQLHQQQPNWDELIQPSDTDLAPSGLHRGSLIRLSYLHATDPTEIAGVIGEIDAGRLDRWLTRLADHWRP